MILKDIQILKLGEYMELSNFRTNTCIERMESLVIRFGNPDENCMYIYDGRGTIFGFILRAEYGGGLLIGDIQVTNPLFKKLEGSLKTIKLFPKLDDKGFVIGFDLDNKFSNPKIELKPIPTRLSDGDRLVKFDVCFRVPKGIDIDIPEALFEMYKYIKTSKPNDKAFRPDVEKSTFDNWLEMVKTNDNRLFGDIEIKKYNQEKDTFE